MSDAEKIEIVKSLIGDAHMTEDQIAAYLAVARSRIIDKMYPFGGHDAAEVPDQYGMLQCELVVRLIARRGGEGQISHGENGVNRMWSNADDSDLLVRITPCVGVCRC